MDPLIRDQPELVLSAGVAGMTSSGQFSPGGAIVAAGGLEEATAAATVMTSTTGIAMQRHLARFMDFICG